PAHLYGGTVTLFASTLAQLGISVKFVDPTNPDNCRAAITERTKAIVGETIGNPRLSILDIEAVGKIGHDHGIPRSVDTTVAAPPLPAGYRAVHEPVQRVLDPARRGNAARAHAAPLRERPRRRQAPGEPPSGRVGAVPGTAQSPPAPPGPEIP